MITRVMFMLLGLVRNDQLLLIFADKLRAIYANNNVMAVFKIVNTLSRTA